MRMNQLTSPMGTYDQYGRLARTSLYQTLRSEVQTVLKHPQMALQSLTQAVGLADTNIMSVNISRQTERGFFAKHNSGSTNDAAKCASNLSVVSHRSLESFKRKWLRRHLCSVHCSPACLLYFLGLRAKTAG
jgi:hypothetical protein